MAGEDKLVRRCFKLAASIFIFTFIGHTAAQLATDFGSPSLEVARTLEVMDGVQGMEGSAHSLLDFMRGDSYTMGFLFFAFGALCWLIAREFDRRSLPYPRSILAFAAGVAWVALALCIRFFPAPPIVFLTIAGGALTFATMRARGRS